MKKCFVILLIPLFTLCGCSNWGGNPAGIQAGAAIGGMLGSIVGDRAGGYTGSQFGALLGTVTGAAVGNAISTPQPIVENSNEDNYYSPNNSSSSYLPYQPTSVPSPIVISNIRFVDNNNNHVINPLENCKIIFDISNDSPVAIYNVTPVISITGVKNINVSPSQVISYMEPGSKIRYTATVLAGKRLKSGMANFNIYATDSNGSISEYHNFSLPTQK